MAFIITIGGVEILLATISITLLLAAEFLSPRYGRVRTSIRLSRLNPIAIFFGALFIAVVVASLIFYTVLQT